jgi:hypothetical protein
MAKERLEGRNGEIWHRYTVRQQTQAMIAEELNISQARVSEIITEVRASIPPIDREQLVASSLELVAYVKQQAMEIVDLAGAPVFVGKDGAIAYDENGQVVRDHSGRLAALKMAMDADNVIAKRLGLDAAQKIEQSGSVRYEIVGVDTEDLS